MDLTIVYRERNTVRNYMIIGLIIGALFACAEYFITQFADEPEAFVPLIGRSLLSAILIAGSIAIFELLFEHHFNQRTFLYLVFVKSIFYTISTTFWLVLTNGIWFALNGGLSISEELVFLPEK